MQTVERSIPFVVFLKSDIAWHKALETAWHTINLTSRRPGVLHVIHIGGLSVLPWENYTHKTLFPVAHQEHSSTEQHSTMALRYSRYRLAAVFLRDRYEALTRSVRNRDFARQGNRARQQGKGAGIFSTLPFSALRLSNHFSALLFYCSPLCKSSSWEAIPMTFYFKKKCLKNMAPGIWGGPRCCHFSNILQGGPQKAKKRNFSIRSNFIIIVIIIIIMKTYSQRTAA